MASYSNTELNATIDEKWNAEIEDARYASGVFLNRIANKSGDVKKSGDIIHVTIKQRYTVGDIGANGVFNAQTTTPDTQAITVNQNKQIAIEVEDIAQAQSFWDPNSDIPKDAGEAYAEFYDSIIAGQFGSFNLTAVGSDQNPTSFGKNHMLAACLRMADANIPEDDQSFCLPPVAFFGGLLNEIQFTAADQSGAAKNILQTGYKFTLLGRPFYLSTTVPTAGIGNNIRRGALLHRSSLAIAFQRNNVIKRADRTAALVDSYVTLIKSLLGIAVIRANHGVAINIAASANP